MNISSLSGRVFLLASALLAGSFVFAAEPVSPPAPEPPPPSMQAFGTANADCLEWTDFCLVCRKLDLPANAKTAESATQSGDEVQDQDIACSTTGIACQPKTIICTEQRRADPP